MPEPDRQCLVVRYRGIPLAARRHARGDDASQADVTVLEQQLAQTGALLADEARASIEVDTTRPHDIADSARRRMQQSMRHLR